MLYNHNTTQQMAFVKVRELFDEQLGKYYSKLKGHSVFWHTEECTGSVNLQLKTGQTIDLEIEVNSNIINLLLTLPFVFLPFNKLLTKK